MSDKDKNENAEGEGNAEDRFVYKQGDIEILNEHERPKLDKQKGDAERDKAE